MTETPAMSALSSQIPLETTAATQVAGRVRILHLHSGNLYGGVETLLVTLANLRRLCPTMEPHFALCYEGRLSDELTSCRRYRCIGWESARQPALDAVARAPPVARTSLARTL